MIIRKAYLKEYVPPPPRQLTRASLLMPALPRMITAHQLRDPGLVKFWQSMSTQLFANVKELYDQIDTQYKERSGDEGMGGQMAVSNRVPVRCIIATLARRY